MAGAVMFIAVAGILLAIASVKRSAEWERAAIFRLGRFTGLRGPGLFIVAPFIDRAQMIDMRPRNSKIDTVRGSTSVQWRIEDPALAVNQVADFAGIVERAVVAASRDAGDRSDLRRLLNERLGPLGITVDAVER